MSEPDYSQQGKQFFAEELAVFFTGLPGEVNREYAEAVMSAALDATDGDLSESLELAKRVCGVTE